MKKVKYTGSGLRLARHGMIKKGQVVPLHEIEWDSVKSNKDFKLLSKIPDAEKLLQYSKILPLPYKEFNLAKVAWESPNIYNRLIARMSSRKCKLMLHYMRKAGCDIREVNDLDSRADLVDLAIEHSRYCGWDKVSMNDRMALSLSIPKEKVYLEFNSVSDKVSSSKRTPPIRKRNKTNTNKQK